MINLKEFIKDVLWDVSMAVQELNDTNVSTEHSQNKVMFEFNRTKDSRNYAPIEFDVAVVAFSEKTKNNAIGTSVKVIEGQLGEKISVTDEQTSRIKFGIQPFLKAKE